MNLEEAVEMIFEDYDLTCAYGEWLTTETDTLIGNGDMMMAAVNDEVEIEGFVDYAIKNKLL